MTLSQTYISRKQLLVDNLVAKGVTGYTVNDGLTTLINAVLEIGPTPPTPVVSSVSLSADKSILSYADSESATLSATVLDSNDDPMSGVTVEFFKGSTSLGTADTNSSGVATKSYASAGVGDVGFTAECGSLVSETFSLEDCLFYDSLTADKSRYTTVSGTPSISYSNNGLTVTSSVASVGLIKNNALTLPSNYQAEITISQQSSGYGGGVCFDDMLLDSGSASICAIYKLSNTSLLANNLSRFETGDVVRIVKDGTTFKYYLNYVLKSTVTISGDTHYQQFRTYKDRSTTYKDLKIKPL